MMQVKFKKLHMNAAAPTRATASSAGFDLTALKVEIDVFDKGNILYTVHTGIAVEIPEGYFGLLCARSSVCKTGLILSDGCGVIDSDYRGEVMGKFYLHSDNGGNAYEAGERCVQLLILPLPSVEMVEAASLSDTARGVGGYGSTGR